jgi:hypothetical protein
VAQMTTFVIKKYETERNDKVDDKQQEEDTKEVNISVSGSISEIVAKALQEKFSTRASITEKEDTDSSTVAISTEDINKDPIEAFNMVPKDSVLYIHNNGFKTSKEEWMLTNLPNKNVRAFYTLESFLSYIDTKLS